MSIQIDPQSWTRKYTDLLESRRILDKENFSWNYQKDGQFTTCSTKTC